MNGLTVPVASGTSGDISLADYISVLPNNSTVAGYQNRDKIAEMLSGLGKSTPGRQARMASVGCSIS